MSAPKRHDTGGAYRLTMNTIRATIASTTSTLTRFTLTPSLLSHLASEVLEQWAPLLMRRIG